MVVTRVDRQQTTARRQGPRRPLLSIVLGGAIAFGLLGIFVGPVLLAVGYTLVLEWSSRREAAPDGMP